MSSLKEILALVRDVVTIIGFPLIVYRIWILRNTFIQDHENKRNSRAIDLIRDWTKSLNHKSSSARKLVETFDKQTCIKLNKQEKIEIENSQASKNYLKIIFDRDFIEINSKLIIEIEDSSKLRWEIITYLNTLESILAAYKHNVADKEMIKEQFTYLVKVEENHFVLEQFREASGINSYPGIYLFSNELKNDIQPKGPGKRKTGVI